MSSTAISPIRTENFPEWYQQVIKNADLAENSPVRGCMVIKPWGYGLWEQIQRILDGHIKATGHENAYFPLFIPLSFLEKEATHVEGFAKECAVVTHHRLEAKDGKLIPSGKLEEPLIVRPTSETIIGDAFSKWVQSYRDLPLLINQWANVVRWEMRPRLFLRTAEFLWQEGHTVHASENEAIEEAKKMHEVYRKVIEESLAIPCILGEKPTYERFPGAEMTLTLEAMMQDGKALQAATSHYLGQNFSKASNIQFLNRDGVREYGYTTSWGLSTRTIGGMIMVHGDDNGLRVPPRIAPKHAVILPVVPKEDQEEAVFNFADKVAQAASSAHYMSNPVVVSVDKRDLRGGDKSWQWIKKGIPLRIEVGPRDIEKNSVVLYRRDKGPKDKEFIPLEKLSEVIPAVLEEIQASYLAQATAYKEERTRTDITNYENFQEFFSCSEGLDGGFVIAPWSEAPESEALLAELKVSVRCIPFNAQAAEGPCVLTGQKASKVAVFAKSY
jgi:prolyl-tRNA synthetase